MMFNHKSVKLAVAGAVVLGLVAAGASSASAAVPNGSKGPLYFLNGQDASQIPDGTSIPFTTTVIGSGSDTDYQAPLYGSADSTGVIYFVSKPGDEGDMSKYIGYNIFGFADPAAKSVVAASIKLSQLSYGAGGANKVKTDGGDYSLGVAFTKSQDSALASSAPYFAPIHVTAGTGAWTFTAPAHCDQSPKPNDCAADEPTDSTDAATKTLNLTTTEGSNVVAIDAGVANAGKTFTATAYSTPVPLGQITLDGNGTGSVDLTGKGINPGESHKIALSSNGVVVAWNTFSLSLPAGTIGGSFTSNVSATVTSTNKFQLVAPASLNVNLGSAKRNQTTSAVALGQFTVVDDRDVLKGWTLGIQATDFVNQSDSSKTISKAALGYAPVGTSLPTGITLGSAQAAGASSFIDVSGTPTPANPGTAFAQGAVNSATGEDGINLNADLTFKAPVDAQKGDYKSTVTLTLVSK